MSKSIAIICGEGAWVKNIPADEKIADHLPTVMFDLGVLRVTQTAEEQLKQSHMFCYNATGLTTAVVCQRNGYILRDHSDPLVAHMNTRRHRSAFHYLEVEVISVDGKIVARELPAATACCVLISSFRKHLQEMQSTIDELHSHGIRVLSPKDGKVLNPQDEFVILDYDPDYLTDGEIQTLVLKKMEISEFTYLVNPNGYLGKSAAFEIGYAAARGLKLFAAEPIEDMHGEFISGVKSVREIVHEFSLLATAGTNSRDPQ